ncbi:MAG: hypothetical protein EXR79_12005 [Myxococcales bacterium]|nr:hypothetical protein [Myxococcales bacterium]
MKLFIQRGFHLGLLAVPAKLVYTMFLAFVAIGLWTSWAIYAARIGPNLDGPAGRPSVTERYVNRASPSASALAPAGSAGPAPGSAAAASGPVLVLGDEPAAAPALAEVTPALAEDTKGPWVLDVFHQHVFSISVVYLILAHLFMLTRLHPALAGTTILGGGLAALAHVLAPVIIWRTGGWQWLMPVSGAAMGLTWTAMVGWSLGAMWFGRPARTSEP